VQYHQTCPVSGVVDCCSYSRDLAPPESSEFWIPSFLFEGDPFLTAAQADGSQAEASFAPVVRLERNGAGLLLGRRVSDSMPVPLTATADANEVT
jgi:hypothetical protein